MIQIVTKGNSNMSILQTLNNPNTSDKEKLESVSDLVAEMRKRYGNESFDIPSPEVCTTEGMVPFSYLEDDSKIEILKDSARNIKAAIIEQLNTTPSLNTTLKVEELISTSDVFANIKNSTNIDFI